MTTVRSQWFAILAVLLLMTAGAMAADRCHCDDVADTACEHAGQACESPHDCDDCQLSCAHDSAVSEAPLPSFPSKAPLAPDLSVRPLLYLSVGTSIRFATVSATRLPIADVPMALRPGDLTLRV